MDSGEKDHKDSPGIWDRLDSTFHTSAKSEHSHPPETPSNHEDPTEQLQRIIQDHHEHGPSGRPNLQSCAAILEYLNEIILTNYYYFNNDIGINRLGKQMITYITVQDTKDFTKPYLIRTENWNNNLKSRIYEKYFFKNGRRRIATFYNNYFDGEPSLQLDHVKNAKEKEDFWAIVSLKNEAEMEIGKIYKNVDENGKVRFQLYDEVGEWIYDVTCETETKSFFGNLGKTVYS
jgi:hypothetical protein